MIPACHGDQEESSAGSDFLNVSISVFLKKNAFSNLSSSHALSQCVHLKPNYLKAEKECVLITVFHCLRALLNQN